MDVFRGLALAFMAVAHCAYLLGVNLVAERFARDIEFQFTRWAEFLLALLGNSCALMLWTTAGMAIALFERGRREAGVPERTILARLLVRPVVLLVVAVAVIPPLWSVKGHAVAYTFDILSCLAVSMIAMAFLRRLPPRVLLVVMLALTAAIPALLQVFALEPERPGEFWRAVWLHFSLRTHPAIWYPILPWLPLMAFGYLVARWARPEMLDRPGPWLRAALLAFAAFAVFRFAGPYFNLVDELPMAAWPRLVVLCREPPSLAWLAWNLGVALCYYAALAAGSARTNSAWLAPLREIGREPLVFFVTHFAVYQLLTHEAKRFPGGDPVVRMLVLSAVGLVVLTFVCGGVGRLREKYPRSLLRYV
ncbi:MAG: heparan-alpha-glucosaminide N-acetyltransferase domain-containing protein [Candidatus Eisenbacteria bacterium]